MKGVFVNCPACRKPLFKNAYLRPGSFLTVKCFHCGKGVEAAADPGRLVLKVIPNPAENVDLTTSEDDDIVLLNI